MKVFNGFDPERQLIVVTITSNLLTKYFPNFKGMIKSSSGMPDGIKVERESSDTANILFPLPKDSEKKRVDSSKMAIALDKIMMDNLFDTVNRFVNLAMKKELSQIEFLPLSGYPIEDLKNDVEQAIKGKRHFCLIKDYKDYLENAEKPEKTFNFDQIKVEYLSEEYCEIATNIMVKGDLKSIADKYFPLMKKFDWY